MKDKEKKAIKRCYRRINELKLNFAITNEDLNAIETILNIIQKQEKRLNRQFKLLQKKDKIIKGQECLIETQTHNEEVYEKIFEYKDKMIDLMLDEMAFNHNINSIVDVLTIKKQLKEKFMNKAKEKK